MYQESKVLVIIFWTWVMQQRLLITSTIKMNLPHSWMDLLIIAILWMNTICKLWLSKNALREGQELKIFRNKYLSNNNSNHLLMRCVPQAQQAEIKDHNRLQEDQEVISSSIWWLDKRLQDRVQQRDLNQALQGNLISKCSSTMTHLWINNKGNRLSWIVSSFKTLVGSPTFLSIRQSLISNSMLMHSSNLEERAPLQDVKEWTIPDRRMPKDQQVPIKGWWLGRTSFSKPQTTFWGLWLSNSNKCVISQTIT